MLPEWYHKKIENFNLEDLCEAHKAGYSFICRNGGIAYISMKEDI